MAGSVTLAVVDSVICDAGECDRKCDDPSVMCVTCVIILCVCCAAAQITAQAGGSKMSLTLLIHTSLFATTTGTTGASFSLALAQSMTLVEVEQQRGGPSTFLGTGRALEMLTTWLRSHKCEWGGRKCERQKV